ncbi:MAG: glycoside hydrolase family 19 protein [Saprospiraceae bacterium]
MSKSFTRILFTIGLIALVGSLLAKPKSENEIEYMIKIFLDGIQKAFGKLNQAQVESITQIVWSFQIHGDRDLRKLTYILATAWHESKFLLVKEKRGTPGTDLYARQEAYWPSGYFGRGFVQLTHMINYEKLGRALNINLVKNPDLALDRRTASDIIVIGMMKGLFTGKSLYDYITPGFQDYVNARRVVNGQDRAELIAGYTNSIIFNLEYPIA